MQSMSVVAGQPASDTFIRTSIIDASDDREIAFCTEEYLGHNPPSAMCMNVTSTFNIEQISTTTFSNLEADLFNLGTHANI